MNKAILFIVFLFAIVANADATTRRYRLMFNDDPAHIITVGWEQVSGTDVKVYYGTTDHGTNWNQYSDSIAPYRTTTYMGMTSQFAKITGLSANTAYYFVIKDSEGTSQRYWFKTCPDNADEPLAFISGGDSRSGYTQRIRANKVVAKMRPHAVLFGGDLVNTPSNQTTQDWFDHWQLTTTSDGQMIPTVHSFGNHEAYGTGGANFIRDLFDTPVDTYYKVTFGGNLFSVYTMNGEVMPGHDIVDPNVRAAQKTWLEATLPLDTALWKSAQYHRPMMPHHTTKQDGADEYSDWAKTFYDNGVRLIMESDAHVVKATREVRPVDQGPVTAPVSANWFVEDNIPAGKGLTFIGEGTWGTIRTPDRSHNNTLATASMYQINWIIVSKCQILVRSIDTQSPETMPEHLPGDHFSISPALDALFWKPTELPSGIIEINNCPQPTALMYMDTNEICANESVAFTNQSTNAPTSYKWYFGDGDSSTLENPNHVYSAAGHYDVTLVVSNNGGSDTRELKKQILVKANPVLTSSADTTICEGETVSIAVNGADNYTWDNGLSANDSHSVSPASSTTYTVIGESNACYDTASIDVTVNQVPTVSTNGNSAICEGEDAVLSASGANNFTWDNGLGNGDTHTVQPNQTTTYKVYGESNGCIDSAEVTVTVNPSPALAVSNDRSICEGESITITANGATDYIWSNGLPNTAQHSVSPSSTTTYLVSATENGCTTTDSVTITVNATPVVSINANNLICEGESASLEAVGANNFVWENLGTGSTHNVNPNQTTTYKVYGESNGCIDSAEVTVTVNPSPVLTITNDSEICFGDSISIGVSGADEYNWSAGLGTGDFYTVAPIATTTFEVTGTTGNCSSSEEVTITVNELPVVVLAAFDMDTICETQGSIALPAGTPNGGFYFGNGVSGTMFDPSVSGLGDHEVNYEYVDNKGCTNSDAQTIHVTECLEIVEGSQTIFNIYPNPAQQHLTIERANNSEYTDIQIIDANGKLVFTKSVKEFPLDIDIASWARGTYYIQFSNGEKLALKKKIVLN